MNDRARAIAVLQQARELLLQRLTERIIEAREEILDDALGNSYSGEIETLHDQLGVRLSHLNSLLNSLPPVLEESSHQTMLELPLLSAPPAAEVVIAGAFEHSTVPGDEGYNPEHPHSDAVGSAFASAPAEGSLHVSHWMQGFVDQVLALELEQAGMTLASLLDLSLERARQCAARFHEWSQSQADFLERLQQLRAGLHTGPVNATLMLLWECFGLQGVESIAVLQVMRSRWR